MNYDDTRIPEGYNRARDHGPAFLRLWMDVIAACVPVTTRSILDLGCGTGRFTKSLASQFDARVIGLDPSTKMMDQAAKGRTDERISYANASAEAIPLQDRSVDMVFISMAFHHFTDPSLAARECWRVLDGHGRVCLRTGTRDRVSQYPYVPYFPSSRELIEKRLPSLAHQCGVFESAGFRKIADKIVIQQIAPDYSAYAEKIAAGGDSVLASLDPEEFAAGLDALRSRPAAGMDSPIVEPIDFIVFGKGPS